LPEGRITGAGHEAGAALARRRSFLIPPAAPPANPTRWQPGGDRVVQDLGRETFAVELHRMVENITESWPPVELRAIHASGQA
jgi:hypothetical protein